MPQTLFDNMEKYHLSDISPPAKRKPNGKPYISSTDYLQDSCQSGWTVDLLKAGKDPSPFICGICNGIPKFPVEIISCGDIFCFDCILSFERETPWSTFINPLKCPNCKEIFHLEQAKEIEDVSKALDRRFRLIELTCSYGCGLVAVTKSLIKHEMWECAKRPVKCPNKCNKVLLDAEMETHIDVCERRPPTTRSIHRVQAILPPLTVPARPTPPLKVPGQPVPLPSPIMTTVSSISAATTRAIPNVPVFSSHGEIMEYLQRRLQELDPNSTLQFFEI